MYSFILQKFMEDFNLDNILGEDEINDLFSDIEDSTTEQDNSDTTADKKDNKEDTTEVDPTDLFDGDQLESVGSEDDNEEQEDADTSKGDGASQQKNFYSSIAEALKEDGIFPDLDDDFVKKIKNPEDFAEAIEQQIQARFDERQKRIDDALMGGVEATQIQKYERALDYLGNITSDVLEEESEQGETLRKQLIVQDFINRGYSQERALREVQKSINAGTDIEDAKEALESNKDFITDGYNKLIKERQQQVEVLKKAQQQMAESLKKSLVEDTKVLGDLTIDKSTRQKAFEAVSKPVYKDPNTGELLTALQKYQKEHSVDFLKNIGLLFTLTDGFKNIDGLVKGKVKKEIKKGLKELENTINNTARTSDGNLNFVGSDKDSSFSSWNLDI